MMTPIIYTWDGETMVPMPRFAKACDAQFVVGESYRLDVVEHRSAESHRHYFACLNDAWVNLPESYAERFPTSEHLRKWALCKAGFCDHRSIVAASKAEAQRIAAFMRPMDQYSIVTAVDRVVTVYTPKSQSLRAMGKAEFMRSKQAVLDVIAEMIGTTADELGKNARSAA